jgi:hypothetical protein
MKKFVIFLQLFLCAVFTGTTQVALYEYVSYQKNDRKGFVTLPDFTVPLKKQYKEEKSVYSQPSKVFVVSDIEGQYDIFKQLLIAAGIIDNKLNWIFGRGHLVICGDVFDRGDKVTECLWLIYFLEEKAKAAGGYVHYILGNHEIMNLSDDLRFLNAKYVELAKQKAVLYTTFYNNQTELGLWLRTKNIMEKIGDLLFMHGGVSSYINELGQPVHLINSLTRPYYDNRADSIPPVPELLLSDYGPLWYRGYFMSPPANMRQVDSTLQLFGVKKIIVGHTPVERIASFFSGKVINVDVPHAKGASEGLLIENKKYYRIALNATKTMLD